jgi:hypothetical protein
LYLVAPRRDVAGVWAGDGVLDRLATPPRAGHVLVFLRRRDVRGLTTTPPPVVLLGVRCGIFLFHGPTPNGCPLPIHVVNRGCPCDEPLCKEWRVPRAGTAYRHDTLWMDDQPGKMELRAILSTLLKTKATDRWALCR